MDSTGMKDLISAVHGIEVESFDEFSNDTFWYTRPKDSISSYNSVDKFFFLCKRWASKKGYNIMSCTTRNGGYAYFSEEKGCTPDMHASEQFAVFALCIELNKKVG